MEAMTPSLMAKEEKLRLQTQPEEEPQTTQMPSVENHSSSFKVKANRVEKVRPLQRVLKTYSNNTSQQPSVIVRLRDGRIVRVPLDKLKQKPVNSAMASSVPNMLQLDSRWDHDYKTSVINDPSRPDSQSRH